jgi:hypothetical protein
MTVVDHVTPGPFPGYVSDNFWPLRDAAATNPTSHSFKGWVNEYQDTPSARIDIQGSNFTYGGSSGQFFLGGHIDSMQIYDWSSGRKIYDVAGLNWDYPTSPSLPDYRVFYPALFQFPGDTEYNNNSGVYDPIITGYGNDYIRLKVGSEASSGAGDDTIIGSFDSDIIDGGHGADKVSGREGPDAFVLAGSFDTSGSPPVVAVLDSKAHLNLLPISSAGVWYDTITDYNFAEGDALVLQFTSGLQYETTTPLHTFRAVEDASNAYATLQALLPTGNWVTVAELDGLHPGDQVRTAFDYTIKAPGFALANTQALTVTGTGLTDLGSHGTNWPISGVGDFNGDATSDILWRSPSTGQVDQWQMSSGHWSKSIDLGATKPANWQLAGIGDFDGDGTSDVLWRDIANSQVDQWHMKNGNWAGSIDLGRTKGADWTLAGVADFNGDGTSDVLWRKVDTSQVDQWEMKNGNWSKSIDLGATKGADWTLAGVGDFNGDGTTDVLWRDIKTSQVDQWQMKNGNWSKSIDLGATKGSDWQVAGIGDFNHDGTSDILWFNTNSGQEEYWAMKAGNWGGSKDLGTLDKSWQPSGIGDFNHDGRDDALFLDPATGHVHEQLWMI